jgi:ABC-type glycerol-3-phosphate transport system substrate-binding protein
MRAPDLEAASAGRSSTRGRRQSEARAAYAFIAPFLAFYGLLKLWPIAYGFWISLHNWDTIGFNITFAGMENYGRALRDRLFVNEWDALVSDPDSALKNYYVAPLPQIGEQPAVWGGSHTYVVPLGANADPARVRAAVEYLKFFWDNNLEWARTGHATVRQSVQDSDEYQALPHRDEYVSFGDNVVFNPTTVWAVGFDQVLHEEVTAALLGEKTAEEALNDAQARLNDVASFQ